MSHVVCSKAIITDLDCLEAVLSQHFPKLHLKRGQRTHKWFGRWVKDYHGTDAAYKNGVDPKTFGTCEHAITMDGCGYEIGLVRVPGKEGWTLVWDFWGGHGRMLNEAIGTAGETLMVAYGKEFCSRFAESIGATISTEETEDESIVEIEVNQ